MFYHEIIRDCFRQHYIIIPSWQQDKHSSIEPIDFWDQEYTRIFVSNLYVTQDYWHNILSQTGSLPTNTNDPVQILNVASIVLQRRLLLALPVMPTQFSEAGLTARTLEQENIVYQIRHASVSLLDNPKLKEFSTKEEAQSFIQQFNLDKDTLSILIKEGDWQNNPDVWSIERQIEKLAEQIIEYKMVITQRNVNTPPKAESANTAPQSNVGNRQAGLGSDNSSSPPPVSAQSDEAMVAVAVADSKTETEALGELGMQEYMQQEGIQRDPDFVKRYHGPDDLARTQDGTLVGMEAKGSQDGNTNVATNTEGNKQVSKKANEKRARKMSKKEKQGKVGKISNRQGGAYTKGEMKLYGEINDSKGGKKLISTHTNTTTGEVKVVERNEKGKITKELKTFTISDNKRNMIKKHYEVNA